MKHIVLISSLLVSLSAFAQSAFRPEHMDWTELAGASNKLDSNSAQNTAVPYAYYTFPQVTKWKYHDLQDRFESIRDDRFLSWTSRGGMKRRLTWLYPQDGCFARTNMMLRRFKAKGRSVPNKIFAFGNLQLRSYYVPGNSVSWWYHVAPIVEVDGVRYVIDPAVDHYRPLQVHEWLARIGNTYDTKVVVCGAGTYLPEDNCGLTKLRLVGHEHMQSLMSKEWSSLISLGYSPEVFLGANPPWRR